ncbi:MAG: hypothetical protein ACOYU4_09185 [Thermodesulfobacteriota bacterium]
MRHFTSPAFWQCHKVLPGPIQRLAEKNFKLLKDDPQHPSLHSEKIGRFWSVRIGRFYRALGVDAPGGILWFWIGNHPDYEKLLG